MQRGGDREAVATFLPAHQLSEDIVQFGTDRSDVANAIRLRPHGRVIVAGSTQGDFAGPNARWSDLVAAGLDHDGTVDWTYQHGTDQLDTATGIATRTNSNIYPFSGRSGARPDSRYQ